MIDMNKMSIVELKQLREITDNEINKRLGLNEEFHKRILKLKNILNSFASKGIAVNIEGDDITMRIEFKNGFRAEFDELDNNEEFDIDEYNDNAFDELFIYSCNRNSEIENFYIPLYDNFVATTDSDVLRDEADENLDYEDIELIIKMDSIDYIFTSDI